MSVTAETHPRKAPLPLWRHAEQLIRDLCTLFGEPEQIAHEHTLTAKAHKLLSQWLRGCEALLRQLLLMEAAALTQTETHVDREAASGGPKPRALHTKRFITHDPDHPEAWRVSFRVTAPNSDAGRRGGRRSTSARKPRDPFAWMYPTSEAQWPDPFPKHDVLRKADDAGDGEKGSSASVTRSVSASPSAGASSGEAKQRRFFSAWPLAERAEALLRAFNDPHAYALRLARKLRVNASHANAIVDSIADPHAHHGVIASEVLIDFWRASSAARSVFIPDSS